MNRFVSCALAVAVCVPTLGWAEPPYSVNWSRQPGTASRDRSSSVAVDSADEVKDGRVFLEDDGLGHANGAVLTNTSEVVALEVDYHDEFRAILGTGEEISAQGLILGGNAGAFSRSFDRTGSRPCGV